MVSLKVKAKKFPQINTINIKVKMLCEIISFALILMENNLKFNFFNKPKNMNYFILIGTYCTVQYKERSYWWSLLGTAGAHLDPRQI